jgi:hypothetical protein
MALNYRRLGLPRKAMLTFAIGIAVTVIAIATGSWIPSYGSGAVAIALFVATKNAAKVLQGDAISQHLAKGGRLGSRWAASGLAVAFLAIGFCAIVAFVLVRDAGSKVIIGSKDEIYLSGSATRQDALALGAALQGAGFFRGTGTSVVLSRDPGTTAIAFVVKDGVWDRPEMIDSFEEMAREIAPSVGGFPIKLRLANGSRETKKELNVGKLQMGTRDELYYYGSANASDAIAFEQSLKSSGFLGDRGASVFLSKGNGDTAVSFVVAEGAWANPQTVAAFKVIADQACASVGGFPIHLRLLNSRMELKKEIMLTK